MSASVATALAERGMVPLPWLRLGIRHLLVRRLRAAGLGPTPAEIARMLEVSPIALHTREANEQHYEVPAAFFQLVLGPHLKYSSALWPPGTENLAEAEEAMLDLTCERAQLEDGQDVLELGCGWGSLTSYMARRFPRSRIVAVSNSAPQRRFIEASLPANVRVITADMNDFSTEERFDRVVSVEMFEHLRNYGEVLRRVRSWLRPEGRLFVHVFCHRSYAYPFETDGADDWMGRHFFTGGLMPSLDLLPRFNRDLELDESWAVSGNHYSLTARAWRHQLEARRDEVLRVFQGTYPGSASSWYHRWRLFFLACEELFGYQGGEEWMVGHYRFRPRDTPGRGNPS